MENFFVFNVLKSATASEGVITQSVTEYLEGLVAQDLGIVIDGKTPYSTGVLPTDAKFVQFFLRGRLNGKILSSVEIPVNMVTETNGSRYKADVNAVYRIGTATASNGLPMPDAGEETGVVVINQSYEKGINAQKVAVSLTRRTGETPANFMIRFNAALTAALAKGKPFATAATTNSGADYAITFTVTDRNANVAISGQGKWEGVLPTVVTAKVVGIGVGADVLAVERDRSRHLGNHGYEKLTDLWFSEQMNTDPTLNYHLFNIQWKGETTVGSAVQPVANNTLMFAVPSGSTTPRTNFENFLLEYFPYTDYNGQI